MKKKRLLLFAYFYPPLGGPAVQRPLKVVKYLYDQGWETDVISVKDIVYHSRDESLLKEDKAKGVYRTQSADAMSFLKRTSDKSSLNAGKIYFRTPEFLKRIVRSSFIIDDKYGWLKFAVKQAEELCKKNKYDAVMATIGPYTSALAAYKIYRKFGLPLIIDYRDHWTLNPYIKHLTFIHKLIARRWEKRILQSSSIILTIGRRMSEELMEEFGVGPANKFQVMFNGWDETDFSDIEITPREDKFVISYIGGLYGKRSAKFFLQALQELQNIKGLPNNLTVKFIGNYYRETQAQLAAEKLNNIVEMVPQVEHHTALKYMFQSNLLLLFSPSDSLKSGVTGKIFEYIKSGRMIFSMVPNDSESAEILREHGHHYICPMEDVPKIKQQLTKIFDLNNIPGGFLIKEEYSRENQVKHFAERLRKIT